MTPSAQLGTLQKNAGKMDSVSRIATGTSDAMRDLLRAIKAALGKKVGNKSPTGMNISKNVLPHEQAMAYKVAPGVLGGAAGGVTGVAVADLLRKLHGGGESAGGDTTV